MASRPEMSLASALAGPAMIAFVSYERTVAILFDLYHTYEF